jgi:predicted nucleic acid-binding protein
MRLFLDANILFSAAYREGNSVELLFALARAGHCSLLTSAFAQEEARRNIAAKKPDRLEALEGLLRQVTLVGEPAAAAVAAAIQHRLPAKDAPILAAAVQAKADALVTGDRAHFGHLYGIVVDQVLVLTVAMTFEKLTG